MVVLRCCLLLGAPAPVQEIWKGMCIANWKVPCYSLEYCFLWVMQYIVWGMTKVSKFILPHDHHVRLWNICHGEYWV